MKSPILEYLAMYGIDPAYIIIGFGSLTLILMILYVVTLIKWALQRSLASLP